MSAKSKKIAGDLDKILNEVFKTSKAKQYLHAKKIKNNTWIIGNYLIVEKPHKLYDILNSKNKFKVYEDLYCIDAALALVENLNYSRHTAIASIEKAEKEYVNRYNDVVIFKGIIEKNSANSDIYRHRYQVSLSRMNKALKEIKRYRIMNFDK